MPWLLAEGQTESSFHRAGPSQQVPEHRWRHEPHHGLPPLGPYFPLGLGSPLAGAWGIGHSCLYQGPLGTWPAPAHCCPRTLPGFRPYTHGAWISTQVSESSHLIFAAPHPAHHSLHALPVAICWGRASADPRDHSGWAAACMGPGPTLWASSSAPFPPLGE